MDNVEILGLFIEVSGTRQFCGILSGTFTILGVGLSRISTNLPPLLYTFSPTHTNLETERNIYLNVVDDVYNIKIHDLLFDADFYSAVRLRGMRAINCLQLMGTKCLGGP